MIVIHSLLKYELLYFGLTLEILHEQHGKGVLGNIYIYITKIKIRRRRALS